MILQGHSQIHYGIHDGHYYIETGGSPLNNYWAAFWFIHGCSIDSVSWCEVEID